MRPIVGKIPGFSAIDGSASGRKFGGQWRFRKEEIDVWSKSERQKYKK